MAITHVKDFTPATVTSSGTNVLTSTGGTIGHWLVINSSQEGTGSYPTISGGGVASWVQAANIYNAAGIWSFLWYGLITTASVTTVTITYSSGGSYAAGVGGEFAGLATNPLIASGTVAATSATGASQALTAVSGQLVVGGGTFPIGVASPYTATSGFTNFPTAPPGGGGAAAYALSAWQIVTSSNTFQNTYTCQSSSAYTATSAVFGFPVTNGLMAFF